MVFHQEDGSGSASGWGIEWSSWGPKDRMSWALYSSSPPGMGLGAWEAPEKLAQRIRGQGVPAHCFLWLPMPHPPDSSWVLWQN